ncbi:MAG: TasA family protein [Marmoricola sp.]
MALHLNKKKLIAAAAVPAALLASGGLVWSASYSAFSATTSNPTNNWSAGTVALTDNDSETALFTATNLKPGATAAKCITVTSTGSLASTVKLYSTDYATTNNLAGNINLKVEEGSGSTNADCTGFTAAGAAIFDGTLTSFSSTRTSFANGAGTWAPAAGTQTKSYRVTYLLSANTPDSAQGGTAKVGLTWEAQNS